MKTPEIDQLKCELESARARIQSLESQLQNSQDPSGSVLNAAIEEMHEGIQIIDSNWKYVYLNQAASLHGQRTKEQLLGRTMMECYPGIDKTHMFSELQKTMIDRKPRQLENEFQYPDGRKTWFELHLEAHSHGILIRSLDITQRKQIEGQYLHAQKMDAIGHLAGGIAHDFNNKLGIMKIYCDMALEGMSDSMLTLRDYILKVTTAVEQSSKLTKQLLAFSRKQVLHPKDINVSVLLEESQASLKTLLGETIDVRYFLNSEIQTVRIDPSQFDQVVLNLCINAKDAMPEGGTLTIETSTSYLDEAYCARHAEVQPGTYVVISFNDTGVGMTTETARRIFEPFFTTKELHKGTGLGLSTVHGIVKQSGGHIWVYSEVGIGTTFKIYFPISKASLSVEKEEKTKTHPNPQGHESILLVEDDPLLREAVEIALTSSGYSVFSVSTSEEALPIFAQNQATISLLITDIVLPKMNGHQLSQILLQRKPELKVIYVSGYSENTVTQHGILNTEIVLLQKPFSIKQLLELSRKVLDGSLQTGIF